jgi:hypothetical protein
MVKGGVTESIEHQLEAGRTLIPQKTHVLMPEPVNMLTYVKEGLAGVIYLKTTSIYAGLLEWAQSNQK